MPRLRRDVRCRDRPRSRPRCGGSHPACRSRECGRSRARRSSGAILNTISMSCSMNTTVIFCVSQSSRTLSIIRQRSSVPMPAVGSSSSSTLGSSTSASAISSSFWSPCDSVAAVRLRLPASPSNSIACSARSRVSASGKRRCSTLAAALIGADGGQHGLLHRQRRKDARDLERPADAVAHDLGRRAAGDDRRRRAGSGRNPASARR